MGSYFYLQPLKLRQKSEPKNTSKKTTNKIKKNCLKTNIWSATRVSKENR